MTLTDAMFAYMTIAAMLAARVDARTVEPHGRISGAVGIVIGFSIVCIGWLPAIIWRVLR